MAGSPHSPPCTVIHTSHMETRGVRPLGELPAEDNIAAYEPSPHNSASGEAARLPGPLHDWTATVNNYEWREGEAPEGAGEELGGQCQEAAPEGKAVPGPSEQDPAQLLRRLSALNLAERAVPSVRGHTYDGHRRLTPTLRSQLDAKLRFPDASYPEPLSTEGSPRRRARSLPWNSIPEADVEDDDSPLLCCCKLKKRVQFADSLGFCLASVKHFLPSEEPLVPQAVLARLQSYPPTVAELPVLEDMCVSECPIPAELLARLEERRLCLEQVAASAWGINGHILVKDPGDNAQVKVRYTFNEWLSFLDCPASSAPQSTAPGTQRFHFNLCYPPSTSLIHFALCFTASHGQEFWDNNLGVNYTVSCQHNLQTEVQPSSPEQEECEGPQHW